MSQSVWSGTPRLVGWLRPRVWAIVLYFVASLIANVVVSWCFGRVAGWCVVIALGTMGSLWFRPGLRFLSIRRMYALWARKASGCVVIKGRVRGLQASSDGSRAVLVRTQVRGEARGRKFEAYVQEADDFDLVMADGRAVRVRAAGAQLVKAKPAPRTHALACLKQQAIEQLAADLEPVLHSTPELTSVCRQTLSEGAFIEVFGSLRMAADARRQDVLPRELPLGQELAAGPAGLVIFPWSPTREEWLLNHA
jgi:hypothetical protein